MATFLVWVMTAFTVAAALFAVTLVIGGRTDLMAEMPPDAAPQALPVDRPVRAADVAATRFDRALRGYRMDQVDAVLDRLTAELANRDEAAAGQGDPA
ncbi:MAG: DivIVA domain-containing protein [Mycobacteriales bacterium]